MTSAPKSVDFQWQSVQVLTGALVPESPAESTELPPYQFVNAGGAPLLFTTRRPVHCCGLTESQRGAFRKAARRSCNYIHWRRGAKHNQHLEKSKTDRFAT